MKRLMESLAAKITAIVVSFFIIVILACSVFSIVVMADLDFYTTSKNKSEQRVLSQLAETEVFNIYSNYYSNFRDENSKYDYKEKNILFTVTDSKSNKEIFSNYNGEEYIVSVQREDKIQGSEDDTENDELITIKAYVPKDMKYTDNLSVSLHLVDYFHDMRYTVIFIAFAAAILFIVIISFLICAEGHRKNGLTQLNHLDLVPFDILTVLLIGIAAISIVSVKESYGFYRYIVALLFLSIDYFSILAYVLTFAARIKKGTLLKNNIIYYILRFFWKMCLKVFRKLRYLISHITLVKKTVISILAIAAIELIFLLFSLYTPGLMLFWWLLFGIIISTIIVFMAIAVQKIKKGGEKIASGDLEYKIDTKYMPKDLLDLSESLNNISIGLSNAVNEKIKSERFKTELITNVSHDIKTPLTSIINYVDLIKKEKTENEKITGYIDVLDRQSGRLKKLIEDLVEASKASTGNLAVNFSECEVGVLLSQTIGEFDERLTKSGLKVVLNQPDYPVKILADGRHLWRVFDNLMSNICKYSQHDTRVYLDVYIDDKKVFITFKNISGYELNISSNELMERFVRGDTSRNTEGSGLGLSIAKSLVEIQNGEMNINIDGDLFKVSLIFDQI